MNPKYELWWDRRVNGENTWQPVHGRFYDGEWITLTEIQAFANGLRADPQHFQNVRIIVTETVRREL